MSACLAPLSTRVPTTRTALGTTAERSVTRRHIALLVLTMLAIMLADQALAHGLADKDAAFVAANRGPQFFPFLYLGAKHMVTGYDHLLFLLGVIFFVRSFRQVVLYVSMFSIGHSITLLAGVLGQVQVNAALVDAVIGLSVAYKAFDNLAGFKTFFGVEPDARLVVLGFGLVHGLGLATKVQALHPSADGLVANILAFNLGVELGQIVALAILLGAIAVWRRSRHFGRQAVFANALILTAGFVLIQEQLVSYFVGKV